MLLLARLKNSRFEIRYCVYTYSLYNISEIHNFNQNCNKSTTLTTNELNIKVKKMKKNTTQTILFIIGIVCLPITLYQYFTLGDSDFKYLIGVFVSVWLIYDYYIYKTNKPHILNIIKKKLSKENQ